MFIVGQRCRWYRAVAHFYAGFSAEGSYGQAETDKAGYRVCLGYSAKAFEAPVYAWGIEVVPAVNGTSADYQWSEEGAMIKTSLWQIDKEQLATYAGTDDNATAVAAYSNMVTPVTYTNEAGEEDVPLESEPYLVQASDICTVSDANIYSKVQVDGTNLKALYLPFKNQGVQLQPNELYYACYENVIDGKFQLAQSLHYTNVFRNGQSRISFTLAGEEEEMALTNLVIYSPNASTSGSPQWPWGAFYSYEDDAPMIR